MNKKMVFRSILAIVGCICVVFVLARCKVFSKNSADISAANGSANISLFRAGNRSGGEAPDKYFDKIQPIIGQRCTVCHGCENSPCSLKLVSYRGLIRGGTQAASNKSNLINGYSAERLKDGPLLASDQEWKNAWQVSRAPNVRFNAVAPDAADGGKNAENSLLYLFLKQGNEANKPGFDRTAVRSMEQARYDTGPTQCVANGDEYAAWKQKNPQGGMPFGCPGLKRENEGGYAAGEFDTIESWIMEGAPGPSAQAFANHATPRNPATIATWEQFFNGGANKQKLVARYLYEHLFRARIHFDETPGEFYELVRASNPPGSFPVAELVTAVPNDAPANPAFFYRLRKMTDLITIKDHIVWRANSKIFKRISFLFNQETPQWNVSSLPGYASKNPFIYFQAIPPSIRYKFLLDNSKLILDNFVRSPVCMGSSATFAMDDYAWAWFINPSADPTAQDSGPAAFTAEEWNSINDGTRINSDYIRGQYALSSHNALYLAKQEIALRKIRPNGMKVEDIWDGTCLFDSSTCVSGKNPNAWISALRNETNASTAFGGEGGYPTSVWLFNYSNFERMYYSLSFNYKEWGSAQHKMLTWRDFMHARIEAQDRFIGFLPPENRKSLRKDLSSGWLGEIGVAIFPDRSLGNQTAIAEVKKFFAGFVPGVGDDETLLNGARPGDSSLAQPDDVSVREAYIRAISQVTKRRFSATPNPPTSINSSAKPASVPASVASREALEDAMRNITQRKGFFNSRLPSVAYIRIVPQNWVYTIISHRKYAARNFLTDKIWARRGQSSEDYSSVYRGIIGDYPNIFFDIPLTKAANFFSRLPKIANDSEWLALRSEFMVPKNNDNFWKTVDWYHSWIAQNMPIFGGIVDLREYDNWAIPPESSGK